MGAISRRLDMPLSGAFALLALAGCNSNSAESPRPVAVVTVTPHAAPTLAAIPRVAPIVTRAPLATPTPALADMQPRKTFVDPPLPPELLDDGGLRPLPRPTR